MPKNDGWESFILSTPDHDYDVIEIEYNRKEVASIRKDNSDNGKLIIELRESEEMHTVPLDWLLEVIQFAKEKFFK